jgi:hypothetical protein
VSRLSANAVVRFERFDEPTTIQILDGKRGDGSNITPRDGRVALDSPADTNERDGRMFWARPLLGQNWAEQRFKKPIGRVYQGDLSRCYVPAMSEIIPNRLKLFKV